jgi:uncharacterized OsmC-like protein
MIKHIRIENKPISMRAELSAAKYCSASIMFGKTAKVELECTVEEEE